MTGRLLLVELRRSAAVWVGLGFAGAAAMLTGDPERWDGLWMATVLAHHLSLELLWPLALATGAWQGRRDKASGVTELVASTPRSGLTRVVPRATLVAGCLAGGYLAGLVEGLGRAVLAASYQPPGWHWPVLAGGVAIAAAGLLGLGIGRLLPSRLIPALLAVLALVAVAGPYLLWEEGGASALLLAPGRLGHADGYSVLDGAAVVGVLVWFAALAGTGWALFAADTRRARLLAAVPAVAGLAVALLVLPPTGEAVHRDARATELVCADGAPRVCVNRVHESFLPQIVGPAREALAILAARLPDPPTAAVQETGVYGEPIAQRPNTVHFELIVVGDGTIIPILDTLRDYLLEGAGTWSCGAALDDVETWNRIDGARIAAGLWLRGERTAPDHVWDTHRELADRALATLYALPEDVQVTRVAAMRRAALDCRPDLYEILASPAP